MFTGPLFISILLDANLLCCNSGQNASLVGF